MWQEATCRNPIKYKIGGEKKKRTKRNKLFSLLYKDQGWKLEVYKESNKILVFERFHFSFPRRSSCRPSKRRGLVVTPASRVKDGRFTVHINLDELVSFEDPPNRGLKRYWGEFLFCMHLIHTRKYIHFDNDMMRIRKTPRQTEHKLAWSWK